MTILRILHVVTYMGRGGLESFLMNYYRKLDRNVIQFDFLVHRAQRYDYDDEIELLGGKIFRLSPLNPLSARYRNELFCFLKEHPEYRVIHVHQDCMSSLVLKIAKQAGVPVRIAHAHSSNQDKNLKYPIKLFYRWFIPKYATRLMACSKAAGDWMFCGAPYQLLNNAIDTNSYSFCSKTRKRVRDELGISSKEIVVGHVGRFSSVKNHTFLLDVFHTIQRKTESRLLLVGDGELRGEIEKKARQLGIEDQVIMTGVRSDVAELLQAMDVFVFPSLYEGLPVSLVEAQAAGLPCLISDKVPLECRVTDLVSQLPLAVGKEEWAERALELATVPRENKTEAIRMAGYDIVENAKQLTKFYMSL